MHYKSYSTEDFIQDEAFQRWVFFPNEERNHYWTSFLLHYPLQQEKIEEAREFLLAMNFERRVPESVIERMKLNVNAAIDEFESTQNQGGNAARLPVKGRRSSRFKIAYPIAAVLLLVCFLVGYFIVRKDIPGMKLQSLKFEKQKTPVGKQRQIILADGTHIWLNANSELTYPKNFLDETPREVYLDGEAFFEVAENKEKPFVVHTSGLAIRVLGTAFNVRSYADDEVVETTLVRGKVIIDSDVKDSVRHITLLPNQQALFRKDSRTIALEDAVNTENYTAWKNGWMIFDDKPFAYIKETLERWYNVAIIMEDESSLSCTFSAKFKDKTLQEVLEIFRNTESINYRIEGNQVFINGRLCQYENTN